MATAGEANEWAKEFWDLPLTSLPFGGRHRLGFHLNPLCNGFDTEDGLPPDWRGLAEKVGLGNLEIKNIGREREPTETVLETWQSQLGSTIGALIEHLTSLERWDILGDEIFQKAVKKSRLQTSDGEHKKLRNGLVPVQPDILVDNQTLSPSNHADEKFICAEERLPHYDAIIVHAESEIDFVQEFLVKIERKASMSFFIKLRDLIAGGVRSRQLAKVIKRCRWVMFLLTPAFMDDEECQFCLDIAHAFSPGLRKKILMPVLLKQCDIPDILNYVSLVDLTKPKIHDWQFDIMLSTLQEPTKVSDDDIYKSDILKIKESMSKWLFEHPDSSSSSSSSRRICIYHRPQSSTSCDSSSSQEVSNKHANGIISRNNQDRISEMSDENGAISQTKNGPVAQGNGIKERKPIETSRNSKTSRFFSMCLPRLQKKEKKCEQQSTV